MQLNIYKPNFKSKKLIKKTRKYLTGDYNKKIARDVFEGKNKGYYIFIQNKFIQIEVIDEIPRTYNGKVQRRKLAEKGQGMYYEKVCKVISNLFRYYSDGCRLWEQRAGTENIWEPGSARTG